MAKSWRSMTKVQRDASLFHMKKCLEAKQRGTRMPMKPIFIRKGVGHGTGIETSNNHIQTDLEKPFDEFIKEIESLRDLSYCY